MHVLQGAFATAASVAQTKTFQTIAGGAGTAGVTAWNAFKYNRENFLFDNTARFGRYVAGYSMAIAQAGMYRQDIRDMTELTVSKQDTYHVTGVIFFVLNFQLIMAGRLGVHGPSPPGWVLGLYWANIGTALMFLCVYTWLAMHASARAQAGGTTMLTRSVRLPIPTPVQLDKARKTGNSYERARATDMFRIPFVAPAPEDTSLSSMSAKKAADRSGCCAGLQAKQVKEKTRRIPRWYQMDERSELHTSKDGKAVSSLMPEHFGKFRNLQQEFWAHDVYARIGMLYFMSNWLTSASLYTQCHVFGELRAIWPAWTCSLIFCFAHRAILTCDVVADAPGREKSIPVEKVLPFTPMLTVLGMSLDYSILPQTNGWRAFIYILSWICYLIHAAWSLRMLDLATPVKRSQEQPEEPGQPWWPCEWPVPPAFAAMAYLVAPPKRVDPSQSCIQQEMKAARRSRDPPGKNLTFKKKKQEPSESGTFAWFLFRGAIFVHIMVWAFIIVGRIVEHVNGETLFLKQNNRRTRWPSHMQPWVTPWSRLGTRNEWCHTGGCDRRLSEMGGHQHGPSHVAAEAQRLAAILGPVAQGLGRSAPVAGGTAPATQRPVHRFELGFAAQAKPALVAANSAGDVAALARSHHGYFVQQGLQALKGGVVDFQLIGVEGLGDLLGVSWGDAGLLVTYSNGTLAECAGVPTKGTWPCRKLSTRLPVGDAQVAMAVAARIPGTGQLRAALLFPLESSIALFNEDPTIAEWLPVGEVQAPIANGKIPSFSMGPNADELLVALGNGDVLRWPFQNHPPFRVTMSREDASIADLTWHAVSALSKDRFAHIISPRTTVGAMPSVLIAQH